MNRVFSLLQKLILRQMVIVCVVGLVFFSVQVFKESQPILLAELQAEGTVVSPEGIYYKGTPDNRSIRTDGDLNKNRLQENLDNVRDKLNLDEETPQATKDFLESTQSKVKKGLEPLTGTRRGYYEEKNPEVEIRNAQ